MRRRLAAALAPLLVLTGCGASTIKTSGSITLSINYEPDSPVGRGEVACKAILGGYPDIDEGTLVTIYGPAGEIVAVSRLHAGEALGDSKQCAWKFQAEVPKVDFYQVEVAKYGRVPYTQQDLIDNRVALTLPESTWWSR
jgi:hypothetical protein